MRHDFNLYDLFSMFDPLNKNYLGSYDFERGLNGIRIYAGSDEPDLIIKHFSKGGVRLSFAEFCNIFVSKDAEYARIVNNRMREGHRVFSYETETKLQDLIRLTLRAESMAENMRQRLSRSLDFDTHKAFSDMDLDKNGFITSDEFESMLRHHGISTTALDLKCLMEHFDRNGDGRVSYGEFVSEVRPQSPRKH